MTNIERYNSLFCKVFQVNESDLPSLAIKQTPLWDSVGHMTLIAAIEDEFDILIEPEDMMEITSYTTGKDVLQKYNVIL